MTLNLLQACQNQNITLVEECARSVAESTQKLWILYMMYAVIFYIAQVLVVSMLTRKKGKGFYAGIVALGIINLLIILGFVLLQSNIMIMLELI